MKEYYHSVSRNLPAVLEEYAQDKQCAYFAGTGVPLQGSGEEPLGKLNVTAPLITDAASVVCYVPHRAEYALP